MLNNQPDERVGGFNDLYQKKLQPLFKKPQNIAAAGLGVFGVFVIFMWFFQMKAMIRDPLTRISNSSGSGSDQSQEQIEADLATKDTDGDGLTDGEELNTYKTSPYLEDSDSDGFSDKEELDSGNNPNCPQGKECGQTAAETAEGEADLTQNLYNQLQPNNQQSFLATGTADVQNDASQSASELTEADYMKLLTGDIDAKTLRAIMLEKGADKASLDKLTDEQLMQSYKETFLEASNSQN